MKGLTDKEKIEKYNNLVDKQKVRMRKYFLRTKYKISVDQYDIIFNDQAGLCKICKQTSKNRLCVDHDHITKRIRGLLCTKCNVGLGMFQSSILYLESAVIYLKTLD